MVLYQVLPQRHSCGTEFDKRDVPIDLRVLNGTTYGVKYCPKCDVYVWNELESRDPLVIGNKITAIQANTNLRNNGVPFSMSYLKKQKE